MAFLDNSGDIILDAVLTDTGRMRLAKGDGTFKIVKFALGDDEIDYGLFDKNHASGSAYYDLQIMQTPVLEAFTNNTSVLKHKLMSMPQTNLLYLPTIKLNPTSNDAASAVSLTLGSGNSITGAAAVTSSNVASGIFIVPANEETLTKFGEAATSNSFKNKTGVISRTDSAIRVDQGLDTDEISYLNDLEPDLKETQYIVQLDYRFGYLCSANKSHKPEYSYLDDDNFASYYFSQNTDTQNVYVKDLPKEESDIIRGPSGTSFMFNIDPSQDVDTTNFLFVEHGSKTLKVTNTAGTVDKYYYIDTNVRVTGATTGTSVDIPIRYMRYYSTTAS